MLARLSLYHHQSQHPKPIYPSMAKPNHNREQWTLTAGFILAITILIINGVVSTWNIRKAAENNGLVVHSLEVISGLQALISTATDAETGQRGFLITGNDAYLQPFVAAVDKLSSITAQIKNLIAGIPEHEARITLAERLLGEKIAELRDDPLATRARIRRGPAGGTVG